MALWAWLEKLSDKHKKTRPGELFKQGVFVLVCAGIAVLIDKYLLVEVAAAINSEWLPLTFLQIILLPIILLIGARLLGPSEKILIGKETNKPGGRR